MSFDPASDQVLLLKRAIRLRIAARNECRSCRRTLLRDYVRELEQSLHDTPHLSVSLSDVSLILDLERTYCSKIFRDIAGEPFSDWIRRIRIEQAKKLLRLQHLSVTEISHAVGYKDITTFERNFRRHLGVSPSEFRQASV
jgi:two-component system response regulator YesN